MRRVSLRFGLSQSGIMQDGAHNATVDIKKKRLLSICPALRSIPKRCETHRTRRIKTRHSLPQNHHGMGIFLPLRSSLTLYDMDILSSGTCPFMPHELLNGSQKSQPFSIICVAKLWRKQWMPQPHLIPAFL